MDRKLINNDIKNSGTGEVMSTVSATIKKLQQEFQLWETTLTRFNETERSQCKITLEWTIKDILVHLTTWQQITLARLIAAQKDLDPDYPDWFPGAEPQGELDLGRINVVIYQGHKDDSWNEVHQEWSQRFQKIITLSRLISEEDFITPAKYSWLEKYPLLAVLEGTLEHHEEHRHALDAHHG
jgi:hypothetical protein